MLCHPSDLLILVQLCGTAVHLLRLLLLQHMSAHQRHRLARCARCDSGAGCKDCGLSHHLTWHGCHVVG